jgi:hypothetical protein
MGDNARYREPSGLVKSVDTQAHKEPDERRNPELTRSCAVAGREENLRVDQRAAAVCATPNHIAVIVDCGDDEGAHIREAIFAIDRERVDVERPIGENRHRHRQQTP